MFQTTARALTQAAKRVVGGTAGSRKPAVQLMAQTLQVLRERPLFFLDYVQVAHDVGTDYTTSISFTGPLRNWGHLASRQLIALADTMLSSRSTGRTSYSDELRTSCANTLP